MQIIVAKQCSDMPVSTGRTIDFYDRRESIHGGSAKTLRCAFRATRKPRVYIHVHPFGGTKQCFVKNTAKPMFSTVAKIDCSSGLPETVKR